MSPVPRAVRAVRAVAALGAAAWLLASAFAGGPAHAADQTVMVGSPPGEAKFAPATVTVDPGDTVTWQWASGTGHTVTATKTSTSMSWSKDTPVGFQDPPAVNAAFTTTFTFTKPGIYTYWCKKHTTAMTGKVIVTGATSSPKPSPTASRTASPRPTASRTSSPAPSATSAPAPSASVSLPPLGTPPPGTPPPSPQFPTGQQTFPQQPNGTAFLGSGGLTPQPATGRAKGLPVMLALLLIGGVGSAELRALLANAPVD